MRPALLIPLVDPKTDRVILYDIFVAGKWVGSRRTVAQCIDRLRHLEWPSPIIATNYTINQGKIIFGP